MVVSLYSAGEATEVLSYGDRSTMPLYGEFAAAVVMCEVVTLRGETGEW
jgi:hypothetical protein